jgi:two-component system chemotaxis sensor kinase CheA
MGDRQELLADFIAEALELLDGYDEELVRLEQAPETSELIHSIFRRVHNIKGMCGFLEFTKLEVLSHAGEDLLTDVRKGHIKISSQLIDLLLRLGDSMRSVLLEVKSTGNEGADSHHPILVDLRSARPTLAPPCGGAPTSSLADSTPVATEAIHYDEGLRDSNLPSTPITESSLRVDVALLDRLMNLAGELVLARNQILQLTKTHPDPTFRAIVHKLNAVTSELQEGVMKTRVHPIASLWDKLPRVVRDVSHETGKRVTFSAIGGETELDKAILEAIKDPLIHLIRNAIDHGIETPELRTSAGKIPEGTLSLQAFPDGGYVIIELKDDGGGLNTEKIKQRAVANGLLSSKQAEGMSDSQIHRLIFTPGFSTADSVTTLSGRGVGMDIVRANIEAINGQVQVASDRGRGTMMRLKIPMTLSIIPTILVSCGPETFAIPEAAVLELVKISRSADDNQIIEIGNSSFLSLREQLLPLVCLRRYLGLAPRHSDEDARIALVLCVDGCRFGIVVDEVHDIEEIVVKPLDARLQSLGLYAGATILGDGRIVLIVDPTGMLHHLQLHRPDEVSTFIPTSHTVTQPTSVPTQSYVIVATDIADYTAIPLAYVRRLEQIPAAEFRTIGNTLTLQYRGQVLPVLDWAQQQDSHPHLRDRPIVVLHDENNCDIGLAVHRIVDISTTAQLAETTISSPTPLTLGIIDKQTTVVLDVPSLCKTLVSSAGVSAKGPPAVEGQL